MSVNPLALRSNFLLDLRKAAWALRLLFIMVASLDVACAQSSTGPALYRLNGDSNFQRGCFAPCECAVMSVEPITGTLVLTYIGFDGLYDRYAVSDVNWRCTNYDQSITLFTGSGTYKVGGEVALQQELSLDLQENGGKVEHFDSGLVADSATFPNIHVTISTNGQFCFDTAIEVSASRAPAPQLHVGVTSTNTLVISWASMETFVLQESSDLNATNWIPVTNAPALNNEENQVILPFSSLGNRFYRLRPGGN